jgi:SAM domain (Sterile alpha motif)
MMCATTYCGRPMDVMVWLRSLGIGKYEAAFRENEIDETVLPNMTAEDISSFVSIDDALFGSRDAGPR